MKDTQPITSTDNLNEPPQPAAPQDDVVIAGGGLGGLFTAALLARNGLRVTVLEKNLNPGGGLQSFSRHGKSYDSGMHVMGGWGNGGSLDRITRYLGIRDRIDVVAYDTDCTDVVTALNDGKTYRIAAGRDKFIDTLAGQFPSQRDNLERYVEAIETVADAFPLFNLREDDALAPSMSLPQPAATLAMMPADEFIASFITDRQLQTLLAYINGLYDGRNGRTPAYIHALISKLYMGGSYTFGAPGSHLAQLLTTVIEQAGGRVITGERVVRIVKEPDSRRVLAFETSRGNRYTAHKYVWAAPIHALKAVVDEGLLKRAYMRRIEAMEVSHSIFSVYIALKKGVFPYIGHTSYVHDTLDDPWNLTALDADGTPSGFMYMTPAQGRHGNAAVSDNGNAVVDDGNGVVDGGGNGCYADRLVITALMDYDVVGQWEESTPSTRPAGYAEWKLSMAQRLIAKLARLYPALPGAVEHIDTASPLTVRDCFDAHRGNVYGISRDCNDLLASQLPVVTGASNLFLTGQCVNLHGMCGVPLTALQTAEAILYPRRIIPML